MKVEKADLRLVYKDYSGRPLSRIEAFASWFIDKVFNRKGYYEDGRPVPTWRQLRQGF
jgi:hypothetical protein